MENKTIKTHIGSIECYFQLNQYNHNLPILFIHGTPGNASQVQFYLDDYIKEGHKILSITRPGYGHINYDKLSQTFIRQSEHIKEVLDYFNIDRCIIYAVSGGAAVAYKLINNYPNRIAGAILESPVIGKWEPNKRTYLDRFMESCYRNPLSYKFSHWLTRHCLRITIAITMKYFGEYSIKEAFRLSNLIVHNPDLLNKYSTIFYGYNPMHVGYDIDEAELKSDFHYIPTVKIPIMVIHGNKDREIAFNKVKESCSKLNNIKLIEIKNGNHLLPLSPKNTQTIKERNAFIQHLT